MLTSVAVLPGAALVVAAQLGEQTPETHAGQARSERTEDTPTTSRAEPRTPLPTAATPSPQHRTTPRDGGLGTDSLPRGAEIESSADERRSLDAGAPTSVVPDATPELSPSVVPGPSVPSTGATSVPSTMVTTTDDPYSTATDDTPPQTTLDGGPTSRDVSPFIFHADEPASFECSLDGSPFRPCTSPHEFAELTPGWHTFAVRGTDRAGNTDPSPASWRWLVTGAVQDTTP